MKESAVTWPSNTTCYYTQTVGEREHSNLTLQYHLLLSQSKLCKYGENKGVIEL